MMKLFMLVIVFAITEPTNGLNSRKLEDDNTSAPTGFDNKCGGCPCNSPCVQSPPPPPPPRAPKLPSNKCPPPPPSGGSSDKPSAPTPPSQYVYITGPPGDLYPVDHKYYSKAPGRGFNVGLLQILIGGLLLIFHALR